MSAQPLDGLEPRIRRMLQVLLRNQEAICRPSRGTLEFHFRGKHLEAKLTGFEPLVMGEESSEPPQAGGVGGHVCD